MMGQSRIAWVAAIIAAGVASTALPAVAQGREWWREAAIQRRLELTAAQVSSIDREFRRDLMQRRRLHRELDRIEAEFQRALAEGSEALATSLVPQLVDLQAQQNKMRTRMLLRISWVLSDEQRRQLSALRAARARQSQER
jgi:hypothetical protein